MPTVCYRASHRVWLQTSVVRVDNTNTRLTTVITIMNAALCTAVTRRVRHDINWVRAGWCLVITLRRVSCSLARNRVVIPIKNNPPLSPTRVHPCRGWCRYLYTRNGETREAFRSPCTRARGSPLDIDDRLEIRAISDPGCCRSYNFVFPRKHLFGCGRVGSIYATRDTFLKIVRVTAVRGRDICFLKFSRAVGTEC